MDAALRYHQATKHSPNSVRTSPHFLDWSNQPLPFKQYVNLDKIALPPAPDGLVPLRMSVSEALSPGVSPPGSLSPPSLELAPIATLLFYAAGITRTRINDEGGEVYFRAAACTGALYHIELYLVCRELGELPAGVYHFSPLEFSLGRLRDGDWRPYLSRASGDEPSLARAPAMLVWTSTFWRNAWKYRARAYRHSFWDSGTLLANLLATARALGLPARLVMGFADQAVNRLLDIDPDREAALGVVALGGDEDLEVGAGAPEPQSLGLRTVPLSRAEIDYPAIRELHQASSLATADQARQWRGGATRFALTEKRAAVTIVPASAIPDAASESLGDVIRRRGSTRRFAQQPIPLGALSLVLAGAGDGLSADWRSAYDAPLTELYVIANEVDGLRSGAYLYHREERSLELLKSGNFREEARFLDLEQALAGDAAANIYVLAKLPPILEALGNRGYRAAQLEGGIAGGRAYLGAYGQRFGATGLTFYDDDVIRFFSPRAEGSSVLFLIAVGRPANRAVLYQR